MKIYKALVAGAGGMGRSWAENLTRCERTAVAAWVDIQPDIAAGAAEEMQLEGVLCGTNLQRAIEQAEPDFVVDVTVPEAHHQITLTALGAGIPVLGEKPMAASMRQAREMVAASEKAGKLYMVSQSRRYRADIRAYRELVQRELGDLGILNSDFYVGAHFGGFRDEMASPLILDMSIHTLDAARYVSGADPVSVYCEEFNPSWSWYKGNACASAIFEMTLGLRYTYRGSWCSEGRHTSWEAEWRAVGSRGSATWDGGDEIIGEIVTRTPGFMSEFKTVQPPIPEMEHSGIAGSLADFLQSLETGETPLGECRDNIKSLAMVFAAIRSSAEGRRVPVEW